MANVLKRLLSARLGGSMNEYSGLEVEDFDIRTHSRDSETRIQTWQNPNVVFDNE